MHPKLATTLRLIDDRTIRAESRATSASDFDKAHRLAAACRAAAEAAGEDFDYRRCFNACRKQIRERREREQRVLEEQKEQRERWHAAYRARA